MRKKDNPSQTSKLKSTPKPPKVKKQKDVPFLRFHPAYILSSWFWVGRLRPASGTWGTLAALPLWWGLFQFGTQFAYMLTLVSLFILGSITIEKIERKVGKKEFHDASIFVIDEVVGVGITLLPLYILLEDPAFRYEPHALIAGLIYGFLAFRLCDATKPWPICVVDEKLHNGWGVMLDDALAGVLGGVLVILAFMAWAFTQYTIAEGYLGLADFWPAFALMFTLVHMPLITGAIILYGLLWLWRMIQKKLG